jgi:ATPase subunit of ABC transporter with duplicated ATPase domains
MSPSLLKDHRERMLSFSTQVGKTCLADEGEPLFSCACRVRKKAKMDELPSRLKTFLTEAADRRRDARLPKALTEAMERLSGQVDQPCVVAVVGRRKAGKSTFLNALPGEDLATVGAAETTATINYFRYGQPNPQRPV